MTHVPRWVYYLIVLASVYAGIALYGVLRPLGLEALPSLCICGLYSIGFYNLIVFFLRNMR